MERGNVTVSLPTDLLREAKHMAVDRGLSLSGFLTQLLEERVLAARRRREARSRQRRLLQKGLHLGTHGQIGWSRECLHDR
jgi:Ribbon-helix-helix protein, copG family.